MDLSCYVSQTNLLPFEFIYAIHASASLAHDILIVLGV
jgi:preprotein translocase subunit SecF